MKVCEVSVLALVRKKKRRGEGEVPAVVVEEEV